MLRVVLRSGSSHRRESSSDPHHQNFLIQALGLCFVFSPFSLLVGLALQQGVALKVLFTPDEGETI